MVVRVSAVPLLPGRGCSLFDPPSVARVILLLHYFEGKVAKAVHGQGLEQESGSEHACVEMLLVFDFQLFTQGFPYGFIAIVRNAHVEGEDIAAKIPVAQ